MNKIPINERLIGLEILRFISGVAVLIWHYQHFFMVKGAEKFVTDKQPFYNLLGLFYNYGFFGVEFFWCLSGYILTWKYYNLISEKTISPNNFIWLRLSRLYPLHLLTLILVAGCQAIYLSKNNTYFIYGNNSIYEFFLQLTMLTGWKNDLGVGFNAPIWSVSVEIFAYIIFFIALRYVSNSPFVNVGIIIIGVTALVFKLDSQIIRCLLFFYIGGLVCITKSHFKKLKIEYFILIIISVTVLLIPFLIYYFEIYKKPFFITLFLLSYFPALIYVFATNFRVSNWLEKLCQNCGYITYSIYLIHFPVQLLMVLLLQQHNVTISYYSPQFFIAYIFITIFISYQCFIHFEKPFQNYIRLKTLQP